MEFAESVYMKIPKNLLTDVEEFLRSKGYIDNTRLLKKEVYEEMDEIGALQNQERLKDCLLKTFCALDSEVDESVQITIRADVDAMNEPYIDEIILEGIVDSFNYAEELKVLVDKDFNSFLLLGYSLFHFDEGVDQLHATLSENEVFTIL